VTEKEINIIDATAECLSTFGRVSLAEMDAVSLQERQDTKFVFPASYLPGVLDAICPFYKVMQIEQRVIFSYETMYYDTDDLQTYLMHHNMRPNRFKVRIRHYVNSHSAFLEIKSKRKGKTVKSRIAVTENEYGLTNEAADLFLSKNLSFDCSQLSPALWVTYNRFTIADHEFQERATFDLNLVATNVRSGKTMKFDSLAIAEVKQPKFSRLSPLMRQLHEGHVQPMNFSKYCMGILNCFPNVKYNRFKKNLLRVEKLYKAINQ
jgi:VTC domain